MNRGGLILINTAKDLLKQDGCEILGRFFIALISQAAQERAAIPRRRGEALSCISMKRRTILMKASRVFSIRRENTKWGLSLPTKTLTNLTRNCARRFCLVPRSNWSGAYRPRMPEIFAKEMNCEPEFLQNMRKGKESTQFACFVRNQTRQPIVLTVPFGQMEKQEKLTSEELEQILRETRMRLSGGEERGKRAGVAKD